MSGESLYIHYPYCRHLCNYCDFYKKPLDSKVDYAVLEKSLAKNFEDIEALAKSKEIELGRKLDTIYLGGGTPSLWGAEGARFLQKFFKERSLELNAGGEFTLEVDPGAWSEDGLKEWKRAGANRFSIGVQAFHEEFLKIMDRAHDLAEVKRTLKVFQNDKDNFSVDLMLGLPHSLEKKRDVVEELKHLLDFRPSHFSVYILKTRKNYPHNAYLPEDDVVSEEYLRVSDFLRGQGFLHYEVSNFGLAGRESRHNHKYWEAATVHALGPNATGFLRLGEKGQDAAAIRYQHKPSGGGISEEALGEQELKLEEVYLGLRTNRGLNLVSHFPEFFGKVEKLVQRWQEAGYVHCFESGHLTLEPQGYLMIDSIMDDLFRENLL